MHIPTEGVGSVPRPAYLIEAAIGHSNGSVSPQELNIAVDRALSETMAEMEATGSEIVTDGEQSKSSFVTYPLTGITNLAPDGLEINFEDGHKRQLPRLTAGPFKYGAYSGEYVTRARQLTNRRLKQAVISPSAMFLLYPESGVDGYAKEDFQADVIAECEKDIRSAFDAGAEVVQIDFTEGRLACKLDPSKSILKALVELNNAVLARFSEEERSRIGVHTCPGGDQNSTHSADVDYAELLPDLFQMNAGRFYLQMASEADKPRVLDIVQRTRQATQTTFIGVTDPCDTTVEPVELVRDRTLEIAEHLKGERFGTTDDCGFSPFGDDIAMARATAFSKIKSRVEGTKLAASRLN